MLFRATALFASFALAGAALAQDKPEEEQKEDTTLKKAGEIVSQPVKDVGITRTEIPDVLTRAVSQPYAPAGRGCQPVVAAIAELNEALGPDFGTDSKENEDKFGQLAAAGGAAVVNSLIPLRGLVREVSGAGPAQRRLDAAVNAGLARRGYLRGLAVSRGCKLPPPPSQVAEKR